MPALHFVEGNTLFLRWRWTAMGVSLFPWSFWHDHFVVSFVPGKDGVLPVARCTCWFASSRGHCVHEYAGLHLEKFADYRGESVANVPPAKVGQQALKAQDATRRKAAARAKAIDRKRSGASFPQSRAAKQRRRSA